MNENILVSKSNLRIKYDEKSNDLKAQMDLEYTYNDGRKEVVSRKTDGIDGVNSFLRGILGFNPGVNLRQLIATNKIKLDGEASIRYDFDFVNNRIVKKSLRRADIRAIEGRPYDDQPIVSNEPAPASAPKKDDTITESVNKAEIIREVIKLNPTVEFKVMNDADGNPSYIMSSVPGEELKLPGKFYYNEKNGITNKHETLLGAYTSIEVRPLVKEKEDSEEKKEEIIDVSNSSDFNEVVKEIKKLNPTVEIKEDKDNKKILIPKDTTLVLPKGFMYNKEIGIVGANLIIKIGELVKAKEEPKKEEKKDNSIVQKGKDTIEKVKTTTKEKTSKIRNLAIVNWKKLRNIVIGGLVIAGIAYVAAPKGSTYNNNSNNDRSNSNNDNYYNNYDDGTVATTFNTSEAAAYQNAYVPVSSPEPYYEEATVASRYNQDGNYSFEENQLNDVVGYCYQNVSDVYQFINGGNLNEYMNPSNLENLVSYSDRDAVAVISNARNSVINTAYGSRNVPFTMSEVNRFLNEYVNYVYEGGTVFDGQPIKAFDYLDTFSQYVVTVVGESMLQLYPGYNYSSPYVEYSYEDLINRLAQYHDNFSNELTNSNGRGY